MPIRDLANNLVPVLFETLELDGDTQTTPAIDMVDLELGAMFIPTAFNVIGEVKVVVQESDQNLFAPWTDLPEDKYTVGYDLSFNSDFTPPSVIEKIGVFSTKRFIRIAATCEAGSSAAVSCAAILGSEYLAADSVDDIVSS